MTGTGDLTGAAVPGVSAIVFDTFGTLVDWRTCVARELGEWGAARGMTGDWAALADGWRARYTPSLNRVRDGSADWTILDDLHRASLLDLFAASGLPAPTAEETEHLVHAWHRLDPWDDVVPGLTRLRRSYVIGPMSNGNTSLLVDLARHGGLPWDVVLGCDVYRHYKPDPEVYLGFGEYFRLPPERVMLAAAHPGDLDAAAAVGLRTAYIPRPREHGPDRAFEAAVGDWDLTVGGVEELAERMGT